MTVCAAWTRHGRLMDGAAGDGGLPREYHRAWPDYLLLSVRLGGLSWRARAGCMQGVAGTEVGSSNPLSPVDPRPAAVTLDEAADSWNTDTGGNLTITLTGQTVTGNVSATLSGAPNGTATGTVANLQVSGSMDVPGDRIRRVDARRHRRLANHSRMPIETPKTTNSETGMVRMLSTTSA